MGPMDDLIGCSQEDELIYGSRQQQHQQQQSLSNSNHVSSNSKPSQRRRKSDRRSLNVPNGPQRGVVATHPPQAGIIQSSSTALGGGAGKAGTSVFVPPSSNAFSQPVDAVALPHAKEITTAIAHRSPSARYELSGPGGTRGEEARGLHADHVKQLKLQGFSTGLAYALAANAVAYDHRIWIVDNSGSMQIGDGHRIVSLRGKGENYKAIQSTRWEEIRDTVKYHAEMAALLDSPTIFKLLNDPGRKVGPQQFSVAERGDKMSKEDIHIAIEVMQKAKPGGVTPLTQHIWDIQQSMVQMTPQLKKEGKKVVLVLATDGLPTDEQGYGGEVITDEFVRALRSLEGLPVWMVVRLCTDEEQVTRFYNSLDGLLELSLEVLDDFVGEAREVYRHNKWLNYALPIHRSRELGYHDRLFDLIDERSLTKGELKDFCNLLLGEEGQTEDLPDPAADFDGFIKAIQNLLKKEQLQWDPIKKKMMPWIDLKMLKKVYGEKSKCTVM